MSEPQDDLRRQLHGIRSTSPDQDIEVANTFDLEFGLQLGRDPSPERLGQVLQIYQNRLRRRFEQMGTPFEEGYFNPRYYETNLQTICDHTFAIRDRLLAENIYEDWKRDVQEIMLNQRSNLSEERIQEICEIYQNRYRAEHQNLLQLRDDYVIHIRTKPDSYLDTRPQESTLRNLWSALYMTQVFASILRPMELARQLWEYRQLDLD